MNHPATIPFLVYGDKNGNIRDFPDLKMAGMSNSRFFLPEKKDIIELPKGSELFVLPGRLPIGCNPTSGEPFLFPADPDDPKKSIQAVAAFMAPAHTSTFNAAYQSKDDSAPLLPLFAYSSVGWYDDRFWVTAFRSDMDKRQDLDQFNQRVIQRNTTQKLKQYRSNRLVQHLGKCCLTYGCPAARNYFLNRWEAPLPTSPSCNARCVGCISLQPSGCCSSTQERINFVPTVREITEIGIPHLEYADQAIISFGQGCEGEPLLQSELIGEAIKTIRKKSSKGTINLNSNSSIPSSIEKLAQAGLDSLRVSLNSSQESFYNRYYRPTNYCFNDVKESISIMKKHGRFVSLNYFILPGVTDSFDEFNSLRKLLTNCKPDLIQLRNLNMDPLWYLNTIKFPQDSKSMGMRLWLKSLKQEFPALRFGYFNPSLSQ